MNRKKYLTAPPPSHKTPGAIPYILVNEAAERFAFYGMTAILVIYMTTHLKAPDGSLDVMNNKQARFWFHSFKSAVYFLPLLGAVISDIWLGKFKTIIFFSILYCLGFFSLVVDQTRLGLAAAMLLMAVGAGIIKPCVSANVGDQFGTSNKHLISKIYGWFYFSINVGAAVSMALCPWLRDKFGPRIAFAVPAGSMLLATAAFWMGRWKFVHIRPAGWEFVKESFSGQGLRAIARLCIIYIFVIMFWALFDQSQSAWVLQAEKMDLHILGFTLLPEQPQAFNPVLVMIMIPLFAYVIYPAINRIFPLTLLRKISIGLFVAALSFTIPAWIETRIQAGQQPNVIWQLIAYIILTAAEIMVSITCLEFSYTQAPKKMKSFVQGVFFISIALGNTFTAVVNWVIQNFKGAGILTGAGYYWFFTIVMACTAFVFIFFASGYHGKTYIQDEQTES